jgi:ribosome maturation factor RimP
MTRGCGARLRGGNERVYGVYGLADIAALTSLVEPEAQALGFALVRVKLFGGSDGQTLQVMAERPDTRQLTIDDCAALSRRLSDRLDEMEAAGTDPIEGEYRLEVSSPGIDRPLTRLQDYADWAGHEARITLAEKLDGQRTFKGDLAGIGEEAKVVTIRSSAGAVISLPFAMIVDAKLVFTDRLLAATAPLSVEGADEQELEGSADADADDMSADADADDMSANADGDEPAADAAEEELN